MANVPQPVKMVDSEYIRLLSHYSTFTHFRLSQRSVVELEQENLNLNVKLFDAEKKVSKLAQASEDSVSPVWPVLFGCTWFNLAQAVFYELKSRVEGENWVVLFV